MDTDAAQLASWQSGALPQALNGPDNHDGIDEMEGEGGLPVEPEVLPEKLDTKALQNLPTLLGHLGIPNKEEFQEWLQSKSFKPMWDELWTGYIKVQQPADKQRGGRAAKCPSLKETQTAIAKDKSSGKGNYTRNIDKTKWKKEDHYAYFLLHVRKFNMKDVNGLFFHKPMPSDFVDTLLWAVMHRATKSQKSSVFSNHYAQCRTNYRAYSGHKRKATYSAYPSTGKVTKLFAQSLSGPRMQNAFAVREEYMDANSDDTEPDEYIDDDPVPSWDCEPLEPQERLKLTAQSEVMDMTDPFWKVKFVEEALREAVAQPLAACDIETSEVKDYSSGQDSTREAFMWSAELTASQFEDDDSRVAEGYIIEPSQKELQRFADQQEWLDNEALQRENHVEACKKLGIKNHKMPRLRGMRKSATLKYWQPVAIQALLEFESSRSSYLRGGFLADGVGLGKTWVLIGFLLAKSHRLEEQHGHGQSKPTLIVVPPGLISQWADEIHRVTDQFEVYSYYGSGRSNSHGLYESIGLLEQDHFLFDNDRSRRYSIVLTTYQTFTSRHGPKAQARWRKKKGIRKHTRKALMDELDTTWPMCLQGYFETVILDEVQFIRNLETFSAKCIGWLEPAFTICVSATPTWNSISDFRGFVPLLFKNCGAKLSDFNVPSGTNPFNLPDDHPAAICRMTRRAVDTYVFPKYMTQEMAGYRMGKIWEACLIRRTYSSQIPFKNGQCIGKSIPPIQNRILKSSFTELEQEQYDKILPPLEGRLFRRGRDRQNEVRVLMNMDVFRQIILLTTWLPFQHLHKNVMASNMKSVIAQAYEKTLGHTWLKSLEGKIPGFKAPEKTDYFSQLVALLQGSPRLRAELPLICEEVLVRNEKSIVWSAFPAQQAFLAAAFHLVGIDAVVYSASLSQTERTEVVRSFTQDANKTMVLICSYFVNSSGLSLQNLCRNVHLFDTAMSDAYITQAVGRVRRLGQRRVVRVYEIQVKASYNTQHVMRNMSKSIPSMIALLNKAIFDVNVGGGGGEIDIGTWAMTADGNLIKKEDMNAEDTSSTKWLTGKGVLMAMLNIMKGEVVEIDP